MALRKSRPGVPEAESTASFGISPSVASKRPHRRLTHLASFPASRTSEVEPITEDLNTDHLVTHGH